MCVCGGGGGGGFPSAGSADNSFGIMNDEIFNRF